MMRAFWQKFFLKNTSGSGHFFREINANIERVYVMEQRQNISIRLFLTPPFVAGYDEYIKVVTEYNAAFDAHHSFSLKYKADLNEQTRVNALVLDAKYEALLEKFALLKPVLLAARDKGNCH